MLEAESGWVFQDKIPEGIQSVDELAEARH